TTCTPSCTGKACGNDGCGGSCGTCASGYTCNASGQCFTTCTPSCTGKACGNDGCGGSCGTCASGYTCNVSGQCAAICTPSCTGKACGNDGCGGSCGTCASGYTCNVSGQCAATCTPSCTGKACGNDGCGGSCGTCASGYTCNASGQCVASCTANSSKNCYNNDVYWYDSCGNRGAVYDDCGSDETCSAGECGASSSSCTANSSKRCSDGNLYWYDSCGVKGELFQNCGSNSLTADYQCSGTWVQQGMIAKDCINNACAQNSTWSNVTNCSLTGKVCKNGVCVANDTAAPTIYGLAPSGTLYSANAVLTVTTSEAAECRYSSYDKSFDSMTLKFGTSNQTYHSASVVLPKYAAYTYYVRCRDTAGNASAASSKIAFAYASSAVNSLPPASPKETVPADKAAPVISDLLPEGEVSGGEVRISLATSEKATCRYDIADTSYDSMENTLDSDSTGMLQEKSLALANSGAYTYYVKCKDFSGNISKESSVIKFSYAVQDTQDQFGPSISNVFPADTVYQSDIALAVTTNVKATCRYSDQDQEFGSMPGIFSTDDGLRQTATVNLENFGDYNYYVRCQDEKGNAQGSYAVVEFKYKDAAAVLSDVDTVELPDCQQYVSGAADDICDPAADCLCDPDCPVEGDGIDADCANIVDETSGNFFERNGFWILALIGLVLLVIFVIIFIIRRRGLAQNEDDSIEDIDDAEDMDEADVDQAEDAAGDREQSNQYE
ncbi:MAG: hypothetical protein WC329_08540, partial [Candidatus Omnitrophota bacterium]